MEHVDQPRGCAKLNNQVIAAPELGLRVQVGQALEPYRRDPRFVALLGRTGRPPRVDVSAAPPPAIDEGG